MSCIVSKSLYRDRDSEYFLHFFLALIKFSLYTMIKTLANNFDVPIFFVVYTFSLGKKKEISSENPCLKYNMADVWV